MTRRGAIIGFGHIAERAHLGALAAAGCAVVAVVETSPVRRAAALAALPQADVFASVAELLAAPVAQTLGFVDICTPPHLHMGAAALALAQGLHVLCEKPLVLDADHADALASLARAHGVVVTCVHNWTQAPILRRAMALAQSQAWGPLAHVGLRTLRTQPAAAAAHAQNWRVDPRQAGGGILFDHGWHGMSIILRATGAEPQTVAGKISRAGHPTLAVEDTVQLRLTLAGGVTGSFYATWAGHERRNEAVFACARGAIHVVDDRLEVRADDEVVLAESFAESLAGGGYRPTWTQAIVEQFLAEIDRATPRGRALSEAQHTLRLLIGTYESVLMGGAPVTLQRPEILQAAWLQ